MILLGNIVFKTKGKFPSTTPTFTHLSNGGITGFVLGLVYNTVVPLLISHFELLELNLNDIADTRKRTYD